MEEFNLFVHVEHLIWASFAPTEYPAVVRIVWLCNGRLFITQWPASIAYIAKRKKYIDSRYLLC